MGFPPANAEIYYNGAGEPLGWDVPGEPEYCEWCGLSYMGPHECPTDYDDEPEDNQDQQDHEQAMWELRHPEP